MANANSKVVYLAEFDNGIVEITMRDESHCNTFSPQLIEGLYKCFDKIAKNEACKVVILTGYNSYFASGGMEEQLMQIYRGEAKCNDLDFFRLPLDCQVPVIAAMQGHGIGGGFVLGLYADFVIFSQESIYTTNFMKYGFTPGIGSTLILPEKIGQRLGNELMYTARNYRGKELAERGVTFPVIPRKEVINHARNVANMLSSKRRLSLITLKKHLTSKIRSNISIFIEEEVKMHEKTFHQPEVATRINELFKS